jgi:hypothetical protein
MEPRRPRDLGYRALGQARRVGGRVVALVAVTVAATALAACGGGDDGTSAQTPASDGTVTGATGTAATEGADNAGCRRPYSDDSPWNTPIGRSPRYVERDLGVRGELTSSPEQYTYPVYHVTSATPRRTVALSGWFSNVVDGGNRLVNQRAGTTELPIPDAAEAAAGSDAQIILVDTSTGDEWGASHLEKRGDGSFDAWNAYHYSTRWSGVPPYDENGEPFWPRGAGVPYLAGLVRPCEIRRGRIDHALAFAYDSPSAQNVYPATKSDGAGPPDALPEGTRLQLNPELTQETLAARGCTGPCLTIARALQRHGMYVIDNSGRPKVMLEYRGTANWDGLVNANTVRPIPMSEFRVLAPEGTT